MSTSLVREPRQILGALGRDKYPGNVLTSRMSNMTSWTRGPKYSKSAGRSDRDRRGMESDPLATPCKSRTGVESSRVVYGSGERVVVDGWCAPDHGSPRGTAALPQVSDGVRAGVLVEHPGHAQPSQEGATRCLVNAVESSAS